MKQYLDLLQHVLDHGRKREDRTGVGTIGVFGYQMRFNLADGFPLVTTKKMFLRGCIEELLWFLRGSTDNNELVERSVHIWDLWALKEDHVDENTRAPKYIHELIPEICAKLRIGNDEAKNMFHTINLTQGVNGLNKWLTEMGISPYNYDVLLKAGELGPIYGKQWVSWPGRCGETINQIERLIKALQERPYSRRHCISAWNVAYLPDEDHTPEENVVMGNMALAPCHAFFQFYVEDLTDDEIWAQAPEHVRRALVTDGVRWNDWSEDLPIDKYPPYNGRAVLEGMILDHDLKTKRLSCQLYLRSNDLPVGSPFNIASYALLMMMVAQQVDMLPGELVYTIGDAHIYLNQLDGVREQLTREPRPLPKLLLKRKPASIFDYTIDDFALVDYYHHPVIKFELAK